MPREEVKAIAVMSPPPEGKVTVGAVPLETFSPIPLLAKSVRYGELQALIVFAPFPERTSITASVPLRVRVGPVQVVQEDDVAVPAVSKEGTEPAGGRISMKLPPKKVPAAPERLTVTVVVFAAPPKP